MDKLWQHPRQGYIHYTDEEWYETRPVGHDPLERFIRFLTKDAKLSGDNYTNHSIRATCIGTLDKKGFEARHITAISSHKNEATIKTYSMKCPDAKKRAMCKALNESVVPKKKVDNKKALATATAPNPNTTSHVQQVQELTKINSDQNINNSNNQDLPPNFQLSPFEDEENDDFLLEYLQQNPIEEQQPNTVGSESSTMMASTTNSMPIVPRMYFPNSNVTINYNFHK